MYRYFVAYCFVDTLNNLSFGDVVMERDKPIESKEDIEIVRRGIELGLKEENDRLNIVSVSIRNYILMNYRLDELQKKVSKLDSELGIHRVLGNRYGP